MPIRERLHDQLDLVILIGPLREDVVDALPAAVLRHLGDEDARALRRSYRTDGTWGRVTVPAAQDLARDVVEIAPPGLGPAEIATRALDAGYPVLPIRIVVSDGVIGVLMPHDLFDGAAAWHHIRRLLAIADGDHAAPAEQHVTKRPVIAALRVAGLTDPARLRAARKARQTAERQTPPDPQVPGGLAVDRSRRLAGFTSVHLDEAELARLDESAADGPAGRPTRGMKLSALVLDALAESVPATTDFTIRMNVDLRRWAPRGERVEGPFSTSYPIGRLRTMRRDAGSVHASVRSAIDTRAPLAALVSDVVGYAADRMRSPFAMPRGDVIRTSFDVGLSVFPSRVPDDAWRPGASPLLGTILVHPGQVANPYVQMSAVGSQVTIALWDETGIIDQRRFEQTLRAAVSPAATAREEYTA